MKIYFMASPREIKKNPENCRKIHDSIKFLGHKNVSNFVNEVKVEDFYNSDIAKFHKSTMLDLKNADICIFETSIHSLAIGQLINVATQLGKPVIAMYNEKNIPFFLSGSDDEKIQLVHYSHDNINEVLSDAIDYSAAKMDVRFNFFISPSIGNYLDWISKIKKIPRSVYLRGLIEKDLSNNDEYKS